MTAPSTIGVVTEHAEVSLPPAMPPCLNCGEPVALRFCSRCGQQHKDAAQMAVGPLLAELAAEWVAWDSKLLRTIGALLVRPGTLTAAYNAGRRTHYLSPLRLYLVVSALFFLVLGTRTVPLPAGTGAGGSGKIEGHIRLGGQNIDLATLPATVALFDREPNTRRWPFFVRTIARQIVKARQSGKTFTQSLEAQFWNDAPKAMFLLLPAFALLLQLTYRRQKRLYVSHLIFALHCHAFAFLLLTGLVLWPDTWAGHDGGAQSIVFVAVALYIYLALHRVYRQGWGKTLVKFCWLGFNYLFLLTFALLLALGAAFLFA